MSQGTLQMRLAWMHLFYQCFQRADAADFTVYRHVVSLPAWQLRKNPPPPPSLQQKSAKISLTTRKNAKRCCGPDRDSNPGPVTITDTLYPGKETPDAVVRKRGFGEGWWRGRLTKRQSYH